MRDSERHSRLDPPPAERDMARPPKPPGEPPRAKIIKIPEDRIKVPDQGPPKKPPAPEIRIPPKDDELPPIIRPPGPPEERVRCKAARTGGATRPAQPRLLLAVPRSSSQTLG